MIWPFSTPPKRRRTPNPRRNHGSDASSASDGTWSWPTSDDPSADQGGSDASSDVGGGDSGGGGDGGGGGSD